MKEMLEYRSHLLGQQEGIKALASKALPSRFFSFVPLSYSGGKTQDYLDTSIFLLLVFASSRPSLLILVLYSDLYIHTSIIHYLLQIGSIRRGQSVIVSVYL